MRSGLKIVTFYLGCSLGIQVVGLLQGKSN